MVIPISLITQFLGMFVASKTLKINFNFFGIILLTVIPIALSYFLPGVIGLILALVSVFALVKIYDGSASFVKVVAILFISLATQSAVYALFVDPYLENSLKSSESMTIESDGAMAWE